VTASRECGGFSEDIKFGVRRKEWEGDWARDGYKVH
jgi:hypothetical protein